MSQAGSMQSGRHWGDDESKDELSGLSFSDEDIDIIISSPSASRSGLPSGPPDPATPTPSPPSKKAKTLPARERKRRADEAQLTPQAPRIAPSAPTSPGTSAAGSIPP